LIERRPFGAKPPTVSRVIRITANSGDLLILGFNENAATDAAITTSGFNCAFHVFPFGISKSNSYAKL
jgi:hypothetical protein